MKHTLVASILAIAGSSLAFPQTPSVMPGPWTLDVAKSTFSPGRRPRVSTRCSPRSRTASGLLRIASKPTVRRCTSSGTGHSTRKTGPSSAIPARDTVSVKKIDDYTLEVTNKKAGKVTTMLRAVYAKDGKSRTETTTGTNAQGKAVKNVTYWNKQ